MPLPGPRKVPPTLIPVHRSEMPGFENDNAPVPIQRIEESRDVSMERSGVVGVEKQNGK